MLNDFFALSIQHSTFNIYNSRVSVPLFFALYCLEAGLFFLIVPWTRVWTLNPLLHSNLTVSMLAGDAFVRGVVSGFGLVHILIGVKDIVRISLARPGGSREGGGGAHSAHRT